MFNNNEIGIDEIGINTAVATSGGLNLQTEVSKDTKTYLRIEAIRRQVTMGQLLDGIVSQFRNGDKTLPS